MPAPQKSITFSAPLTGLRLDGKTIDGRCRHGT
jgi:hypothetical protein